MVTSVPSGGDTVGKVVQGDKCHMGNLDVFPSILLGT